MPASVVLLVLIQNSLEFLRHETDSFHAPVKILVVLIRGMRQHFSDFLVRRNGRLPLFDRPGPEAALGRGSITSRSWAKEAKVQHKKEGRITLTPAPFQTTLVSAPGMPQETPLVAAKAFLLNG